MIPRTYRALLASPGVPVLLTSSLVARLPNVMAVVALSFWARDLTGTFAWSGAVVGAYTAGVVAASPWLGRLADRFGPVRVLVPCGFLWAAGFIALAALPAAVWWLGIGVAAVTGAVMPPTGPTVRTAWPHLVSGERLRVAYTVDATVQELMYVTGPLLSATLVSFAGSRVAVAGCGLVALGGAAWFATRPVLRGLAGAAGDAETRRGRARRLLLHRGRIGLLLGTAMVVGSFSATQLGLVAFADGYGQRLLSGGLESVWSLASFLGGVLVGVAGARSEAVPWRRIALMMVGLAGCVFAPGPWWLAAALAAAGLAISPAFAAVYERLGQLAPAGARTETFAWLTTATNVGSGVGAVVSGRVIEAYGPSGASALAAVLCALAALALVPAGGTGAVAAEQPAPRPVPQTCQCEASA